VLAFWVVGIEVRLVYLQVFHHAELVARASRQQSGTRTTSAKRGDIVDRRGRVLATSVDVDTIYAVPSEIDDAASAVKQLCGALGDCTPKEREGLTDRLSHQRAFAYVKRQISPDQSRRVAALNLDGVGFLKESHRFYPNKDLAAHLLGYVGVDGNGLGGLESTYDSAVRGKSGTVLIHTDAHRHVFSRTERPPTSGATLELTIDEYLQHVAERELHAGVAENRAAGGTAIVMNPHTGEILAMANEPTFNPNAYRDFDDADRRNRAVQDLYEPGSTFKVVTASAAIEEKVMPIDTLIDTNPGQIRLGTRVVGEYDNHNYGVLSFTDVIVKSSNVGAIKIGLKVGAERLSRFVSLYGFGHPVSPDFPGESSGLVTDAKKLNDTALMSVSMGYQIGVTPLQMVAAISSIANGGAYVQPRVLRAFYHDGRRYVIQPKVERHTISADTASTLTSIMEGVVERGTATKGQIPGYTIAGKTGTAAKLINHVYSHSEYNASFVGFVPSRDPVLAIIVVTDSPHAGPYTGGAVSAPVFKRIAEAALRYLGVAPTVNPAPPVLTARQSDLVNASGPGSAGDQLVVNVVADGPPGTVPDVQGLSAREAMRKLVKVGLAAHLAGDGFVASQDPPAGAPLEAGTVRLVLSRWSARPVNLTNSVNPANPGNLANPANTVRTSQP
jgi:cell division protein FtsI (penicillin-binding protein 3)